MSAKIIDGRAISKTVRATLKKSIDAFVKKGYRRPCLAVILVGDDAASQIYVGHKKKACDAIGIESRVIRLPAKTKQDVLEDYITDLDQDEAVDGILLQLPLPGNLDADHAIDSISPEKDVDGLTPANQGRLIWMRPAHGSCTPLGIMKLIESTGIKIEGKVAAVVGRSVLVGAPMTSMLANAGASIISLHHKSVDCPSLTRQADILVIATGVHRLVDRSWVKPGAVVIDVGIHRFDTGIEGDVIFDDVVEVASHITPVPGGVGPMTIAMLLSNTVDAYKARLDLD